MDNRFPAAFFRVAAICSWLSALTTLMLIFLPDWYLPGDSFEARMARVNDPAYQLRSLAYLVHPFLVMTAALAVAIRLRHIATAWVVPGLLGFLLWGATEAGQQMLTLFAFDPWRLAYLAGDETVRATMELRTALYDGLWNAMYVLVLVAFFIGNALYAAALARLPGLSRVLSGFFGLAALLTGFMLLREFGLASIPASAEEWMYPAVQPLGRTLIGVWLWRAATAELASPVLPEIPLPRPV